MYVRRILVAIYRLSLEVSHSVTCKIVLRVHVALEARTVCCIVNMREARMWSSVRANYHA